MSSFSDEERAQIREDLIQTGREKLIMYGPKKTTVSDITEPVGIATSTFYLFFDSKEDLLGEILDQERTQFVDRIEKELSDVADGQEGLERLFRTYVEWLEESTFIQQALFQSGFNEMQRSLSRDELHQSREEFIARIVPLIDELRGCENRPLTDIDSIALVGVMTTFAHIISFREQFEAYEPTYYEQVKDLHVFALSRGLTKDE